eukprot:CAMPEP_0174353852 /NCGR_PEP_ID=MMETSP0811_2-20130205/17145_1 /TAXON_ID=73025 ORGANISM="Eutreptiella gymnastica-like, Strain CCMP1594" /NCGR_SAMPLE_ID=MMETSP0811_2 /ASSEMBLY_ACC=CAM_ASM_000667 /LENGTH=210 /DNA_ID=CAMNT_0015484501 /DNA_START=508 /DNA_END=1141 /DNA_ORIENTATION=+
MADIAPQRDKRDIGSQRLWLGMPLTLGLGMLAAEIYLWVQGRDRFRPHWWGLGALTHRPVGGKGHQHGDTTGSAGQHPRDIVLGVLVRCVHVGPGSVTVVHPAGGPLIETDPENNSQDGKEKGQECQKSHNHPERLGLPSNLLLGNHNQGDHQGAKEADKCTDDHGCRYSDPARAVERIRVEEIPEAPADLSTPDQRVLRPSREPYGHSG